MTQNSDVKTILIVIVIFIGISILSWYLTRPTPPRKLTKEELYQQTKDSLTNIRISKELDSTYIFEHSKIPTDGK